MPTSKKDTRTFITRELIESRISLLKSEIVDPYIPQNFKYEKEDFVETLEKLLKMLFDV